LLGIKFDIPAVGGGIEVITELHKVAIDFPVMRADDVAFVIFDRADTKQVNPVGVMFILTWLPVSE